MTMKQMDETLEFLGFTVRRHYNSGQKVYVYTISKDGLFATMDFTYPSDVSEGVKDGKQREFIGKIVDLWTKRKCEMFTTPSFAFDNSSMMDTLINYAKQDVQSTNTIAYNLYCKGDFAVKKSSIPTIQNVIFNPPATIVFWADGTKTVVKAQNEDEFDAEKGLAMAISKKALGNQGNYFNTFTKWTEPWKKEKQAIDEKVDAIIEDIRKSDDNIFDQAVRHCVEKFKKDILGAE